MASKSRLFSQLLGAGTSGTIPVTSLATDVPLGTEGYPTVSGLPLSGNNVGDQAFVQETNRLYIWNGTGWYNIALINTNPTIDSNSYDAAYTLDSNGGTSTVIQLIASDPEGIPIQWSYTASDSAQYFANITNDSSVFTITAKSNDSIWSYDSTGGTFSVTFKASDGVNLATALSEFTITFAAPMQPYGWFGGGAPGTVSIVDRIDYANDAAIATVRGPLSSARRYLPATGNADYGWFGGGTPGPVSAVNRIDYAADTGTASIRGSLSLARRNLAATGNDNYGWFSGGWLNISTVDRIDYASDGLIASVRGSLSSGRAYLAASGNIDYGWFGGGRFSPSNTSIVDRITYSNDGITTSVRGPVTIARDNLAATGNSNFGWWAGGYGSAAFRTTVDRIDYAADTGAASARGPLSVGRFYLAATGDTNYGWFGGGRSSTGSTSIVDRITYSNDGITASVRGPLTAGRYGMGATGGYPG